MAIKNRKTKLELIHHSDKGLQYCAKLYKDKLRNNQIKSSIDGYDCYQNALAERINGILKQEFLYTEFKNKQDFGKLIKESVETYNKKRPHLSLKYKTPYLHITKMQSD